MKNLSNYLLLPILIIAVFSCNENAKKQNLTFCSWGGSYQEAQRNAYLLPFQKQYSVQIDEANYNGELAKIQSMIKSNKIEWDVVSVTQEMYSTGVKENLFEKIDFSIVDTTGLMKGMVHPYGIAHLVFSTALAYNSKYYSNKNRPQTWDQFWDIQESPRT